MNQKEEVEKRFKRVCDENDLSQKIATYSNINELEKLFAKTIAEFAAEYMVDRIALIHRLVCILKKRCQ